MYPPRWKSRTAACNFSPTNRYRGGDVPNTPTYHLEPEGALRRPPHQQAQLDGPPPPPQSHWSQRKLAHHFSLNFGAEGTSARKRCGAPLYCYLGLYLYILWCAGVSIFRHFTSHTYTCHWCHWCHPPHHTNIHGY